MMMLPQWLGVMLVTVTCCVVCLSQIAQTKKQRVAAALELINKPQQRLAKGAGSYSAAAEAAAAAGGEGEDEWSSRCLENK